MIPGRLRFSSLFSSSSSPRPRALSTSRSLAMPRVPYRFPSAGEDPIADRVRARRGARGLTPLDATLLNAPAIADGWNTLIGTLRTKNSLPDDVRELMVRL